MAESTFNGQEFSERLIQIIKVNLKNIFDPTMLKSIFFNNLLADKK
jgi:hypothetical protein